MQLASSNDVEADELARLRAVFPAFRIWREDAAAGSGTSPVASVHQTAQAVTPGARVAYVDNDPMVLAHARALLASVLHFLPARQADAAVAAVREWMPPGSYLVRSPPATAGGGHEHIAASR